MRKEVNLVARDGRIIWHPFTQEKTATPPIAIKSVQGSYLFDEDGHKSI